MLGLIPLAPSVRRLVVISLLTWTAAAATYGVLTLTFGERPALIHVRWASGIGDEARARLERQYHLTRGEQLAGRTWGYALMDVSRGNIRLLVGDAATEDTHEINRAAFRMRYRAPRLPYHTSHAWLPVALEDVVGLALIVGGIGFGLALLNAAAPTAIRVALTGVSNAFAHPAAVLDHAAIRSVAIVRGWIPVASAESAALFRIVFGSALLLFLLQHRAASAWASDPSSVVSDAQAPMLRVFAAAPWGVDWLMAWLIVWAIFVIVGAMTRMAFAMLTVGVVVWAILYTTRTSHHTVSALLMALVCLMWARWGDAWSVDAWLHRNHPKPRGLPQEYGYAVWVPSFVLGLTFAAAAFAKVWSGGVGWVLNGTVKYHFLSDSDQAMVDWGLQLGRHPWAAVGLSFGAIAIETFVIVGVISSAYRYRLLAGLGALSLLAGFALFQGVFWPGWWILLLSFLPWHLVLPAATGRTGSRRAESPAPTSWRRVLQPAIVVVLILLVGEQFAVSMLGFEGSPLISAYDMYSTTYSSPASYENKAREYWIVAVDDASQVHDCRVTREQAGLIVHRGPAPSERSRRTQLLQRCFKSIRLSSVTVDVSQNAVDWERWRLNTPARLPLMEPVPANTLQ